MPKHPHALLHGTHHFSVGAMAHDVLMLGHTMLQATHESQKAWHAVLAGSDPP